MNRFVALLLTAAVMLPGCMSRPAPKAAGTAAETTPFSHVKRGKEKIPAENDLRQIGLYFIDFHAAHGKTPANLEEFQASAGPDGAHLVKKIKDGSLVVVWSVALSGANVIAYEKAPDVNGNQVAVFGDNRVVTLPAAQLQAALQKQGVQ